MTDEQRQSTGRPSAERYYTEYVDVSTDKAVSNELLRKAMGEKRQRGWSLVSLDVNQSAGVVELVWDTFGFRTRD